MASACHFKSGYYTTLFLLQGLRIGVDLGEERLWPFVDAMQGNIEDLEKITD